MELPERIPVCGNQNTLYTIKANRLSYRISCSCTKEDTKLVLNKVSCEARPGELLAIAGPSGAGKTTLLEVLAGMVPLTQVLGQILINDRPMDVEHFRRVSGYVTQDDALFPLLTVEETLMYSALLRLHGGQKAATARVRELLKELGLEEIASSRIGGDGEGGHGISGGERRRVSIGVEVVHNPAVLLLDEPTSGLDSASAVQVVSLLKSMAADQSKTVVLTIHQPGFRILELIDQVVLLSEGSILHHGSLQALEAQLKAVGHCIPRHVNVLEFAIDAVESLLIIKSDDNLFLPNHISIFEEKEQEHQKMIKPSDNNPVEMPFSYANSRHKEVLILGRRFCSNIFRTKQLFAARTLQSLVVGFVLGSIFMKVGNEGGQVALQTRVGFFAFSLTFLLSSTTEGLPIFLQERRILMRETSRGAYRVSSYVLANALVFLPFLLMVALLYTTPVYWLVGLRRQLDGFLYFSLVVWMVVLMANSFVACFSALVPNFIMGNSLIAGFMGSFFLFSGYFISEKSIPRYWVFMHYLSLFKYPFEAFMINEYGGQERGRCLQMEAGVCLLDGEGFLRQQGLKEIQRWSNLGVMLSFIFGYRILSLLILWFRCCRMRK
ncbi:ABC transporter-like protein [Cinnamomum micranthum f. kanehirae]|uniref:ABC transporter-like protein n=1 Tax=Cinnamomum micranthum f. kanehirae TaxID=337451 RepID=A0A443P6U5_9MAGN|nr:ABC transporter-like protein [Cinnamomum micranthum f. kanehirae]